MIEQIGLREFLRQRAPLLFVGPEIQLVHARVERRAHAHGTGLQSDVQFAPFRQAPAGKLAARLIDRHHFRMRGGELRLCAAVIAARHHFIFVHDDRADRDLAFF